MGMWKTEVCESPKSLWTLLHHCKFHVVLCLSKLLLSVLSFLCTFRRHNTFPPRHLALLYAISFLTVYIAWFQEGVKFSSLYPSFRFFADRRMNLLISYANLCVTLKTKITLPFGCQVFHFCNYLCRVPLNCIRKGTQCFFVQPI